MKITFRLWLSFFIGIMSISLSLAQPKQFKKGLEIKTEKCNLRILFYTEDIVRITKWIPGNIAERNSLSVIRIPDIVSTLKISKSKNEYSISSKKLNLKISKRNGNITFQTEPSVVLLKEKGNPVFSPIEYFGDAGYSIKQEFELTPEEGLYGLGEQTDGYFNFRGRKILLTQANVGAANSFLVSTHNYGILWDNYSKTIFEDTKGGATFLSDIGDNIDYYFVHGANLDSVISGYRYLTGKAPMYGKWVYGYWQSKEHYETQDEVLAVAEKYRKLQIPIDNIIQDWDYWNGAENWSGMFFDKKIFPQPKEMCDKLHTMNFHIIISIWPALGPKTEIYSDMLKHGFLYKPVGWAGFKYYDAFNPAANALYWKYLKAGLYSKGLDGWWIDSTEPDVVNAMTKESSEYELKKMGSNFKGSWARYLNAFSLAMTDEIYKNWRSETDERRAYVLTRSTFAGQQRNAATTWSGDIGASWDIYRNQISAGLNHCMSGIPYWTFDIGGFVLGSYGGVFMEGGKSPAYQELYTRMFQLGAFCPIFRSHGSETPREIWEMGEFTTTLIKFDNLRYRLLPYIYSLAWLVTDKNYTYMRGLPMDFSKDTATYTIDDQFMFGPSIMVCPVTTPMYYSPPQHSEKISKDYFRTKEGKPGLHAMYFKDNLRQIPGKDCIDSTIDNFWYTGRPDYVTDSMFAVTWEGKLIPKENGLHQFHLVSYDKKRIILNGDTLKLVYSSVEQYTEKVNLQAGKEYAFKVEQESRSTGAAKMQLYWKTPSIFAKETETKFLEKIKSIYLPDRTEWYDFWTGEKIHGGQIIKKASPIDIIPLYVKAGSILPLGPFVQYSTENRNDTIELRIYPGADGRFSLYEDENDNYNYEKGRYSIITFTWNEVKRTLAIEDRKGSFPGMLNKRVMNIILVSKDHGTGLNDKVSYDKSIRYDGKKTNIKF